MGVGLMVREMSCRELAASLDAGDAGCAAAHKGIEDGVAGVGVIFNNP